MGLVWHSASLLGRPFRPASLLALPSRPALKSAGTKDPVFNLTEVSSSAPLQVLPRHHDGVQAGACSAKWQVDRKKRWRRDRGSNLSQLSILDRAVEIHSNIWYCSKVRKYCYGTVVKYCSKFIGLYQSSDLSHQISIGRLKGDQIYGTVVTVANSDLIP
jgi:hypothetical protein